MNQLVIAGIAGIIIAVGGFTAGVRTANWHRDSQDLATERGAKAATEAALKVVQDIPKKFIPIKGAVTKEIYHDTRYLPGACDHTDPVWLQLKAAYEAIGGRWSEDSLPATGATTGSLGGANNAGANSGVASPGKLSSGTGN